ncbi:MAG: hypothetical protein ACTSXW_08970 [Candidatus Baldrarchaeia archaeon]
MSKRGVKNKLFYLTQAISWLDDIRRGHYVSHEKIDKAIRKSDLTRVKSIWKKAKKELRVLTGTLVKEDRIRKYVVAGSFLRVAAILSLGIFGVLYVNAILGFQKHTMLSRIIRNPILIILCIIVIPNAFMIVDYFARHTLRERMVKLGIQEKNRLKKVINELLGVLATEAEKGEIDPKKLKFKMFYDDYDHIEVVKKPGRLRKTYEVIPKL